VPAVALSGHVFYVQEGEFVTPIAHKKLHSLDLSALCDAASLMAIAEYILKYLCDQMKNDCIPAFAMALTQCLDDSCQAISAERLFEVVSEMAGNLSAHLQAIDVVTSQLRAHAHTETPASVLSRIVLLHDSYLSSVSAMLQTSVKADLQKVWISSEILCSWCNI
jgi:hypothetical protein